MSCERRCTCLLTYFPLLDSKVWSTKSDSTEAEARSWADANNKHGTVVPTAASWYRAQLDRTPAQIVAYQPWNPRPLPGPIPPFPNSQPPCARTAPAPPTQTLTHTHLNYTYIQAAEIKSRTYPSDIWMLGPPPDRYTPKHQHTNAPQPSTTPSLMS